MKDAALLLKDEENDDERRSTHKILQNITAERRNTHLSGSYIWIQKQTRFPFHKSSQKCKIFKPESIE